MVFPRSEVFERRRKNLIINISFQTYLLTPPTAQATFNISFIFLQLCPKFFFMTVSFKKVDKTLSVIFSQEHVDMATSQ